MGGQGVFFCEKFAWFEIFAKKTTEGRDRAPVTQVKKVQNPFIKVHFLTFPDMGH
jgi:hypothetical protein